MSIGQLIRAVEEADSALNLLKAVQNLAATKDEEAIPILIKVLAYNNPGAAIAAIDGLVKIGTPAVEPLLKLDSYNYGARSWAVRAIAAIGDPRGLDILLDATINDFALSVRRAAAKGLGSIHWDLLPSQKISQAQLQAYQTLLQSTTDPEWVVRYASVVALEGLAIAVVDNPPHWLGELLTQLGEIVKKDVTLAVKARALFAQEKLSKKS
ncbi:MAG: HEAT repeat domain-containing protein [Microcoleaceae cyanobacterium]|jgi:phycocyanobilin lyase beta subunit